MLDFLALALECAPTVAPQTMEAIVSVESTFNPYAIGVVGGRLARQPKNQEEAVATARQLASEGWNFSLGAAQVNRYNLPKYNIDYAEAFDVCTSLRVGSKILEDCYVRASKRTKDEQAALQQAFSCYYSGNFTRGFKPDKAGEPSYVQKVLASARVESAISPIEITQLQTLASADIEPLAIPVVPSIKTGSGEKPQFDKAAREDPVPLTATPAQPELPPSDNSPVLLEPVKTSTNKNGVQILNTESAAKPDSTVVF